MASQKKQTKPAAENFAVIETGGKQYLVAEGDTLFVEKLEGAKAGEKVSFDKVLLTAKGGKVELGAPAVAGAKVSAEVLVQTRDEKVTVIHYRAKSRYFKKAGHRQPLTKIKIASI